MYLLDAADPSCSGDEQSYSIFRFNKSEIGTVQCSALCSTCCSVVKPSRSEGLLLCSLLDVSLFSLSKDSNQSILQCKTEYVRLH